MAISGVDIGIIIIYGAAVTAVGLGFSKKIKNTEDFYIASRSLNMFVIAATVCASILGGSAMIGKGGVMYSQGVVGILLSIPYLVGMYVFTFMSGRIQQIGVINRIKSIPDLMEYRFGRKTRFLVAGMIAYAMMATVASQIAAFAVVLRIIGGISFEKGVWIALIIIIAYTSASGLYGVVYTDVIQFVTLIVTIYFLLPIKSVTAAGGLSSILENVPAEMLKFNVTPEIIGWIFTSLIFTLAGAEMWQRAFAAKNPRAAKRGMFLGNTVYAATILITLLLSLSALSLYPDIAQKYGTADAAIPALVVNLLPKGFLGLAIIGMLSVIMSTADTYLLISAQTVVCDIIKPLSHSMTDRKELLYSKLFTVLAGICALLISLYIKGVYNLLMFAWTFYAASVGIPAVAALYWKKATAPGICSGVITGFVISIVWNLAGAPFKSERVSGRGGGLPDRYHFSVSGNERQGERLRLSPHRSRRA